MARRLQSKGGERVFVYEAEPCEFWIHRELAALGERCMVVSPALAPRRAVGAGTCNRSVTFWRQGRRVRGRTIGYAACAGWYRSTIS